MFRLSIPYANADPAVRRTVIVSTGAAKVKVLHVPCPLLLSLMFMLLEKTLEPASEPVI